MPSFLRMSFAFFSYTTHKRTQRLVQKRTQHSVTIPSSRLEYPGSQNNRSKNERIINGNSLHDHYELLPSSTSQPNKALMKYKNYIQNRRHLNSWDVLRIMSRSCSTIFHVLHDHEKFAQASFQKHMSEHHRPRFFLKLSLVSSTFSNIFFKC